MKNVIYSMFMLTVLVLTSACEECNISDISTTEGREYTCYQYSFIASIPESCETGGCGLIVDVHGIWGNPEKQEANTRLRELGRNAMERGAETPFIVIQPESPNDLTGWTEDDWPNIHNIVQAVADTWDIDKTRIHFTGFSQGGVMTQWMICNHNDYYASFAPSAGGATQLCFDQPDNLPTSPILYIVGQEDPLAYTPSLEYKDVILDAMAPFDEELMAEGTGYSRTRYTGNGMQFDWIEHCGGHCILGGSPDADGCDCACDISHGETILDFMIAHPKE